LKKNIKQYVFDTKTKDFKEIVEISKVYIRAKNYVYSSFSGVRSYLIIQNPRKNIRDVWTENGFIDNWSINRRYIRNAIDDAASNIKTSWTQTKKAVRQYITDNEKDDKVIHLVNTILKNDKYFYNVLNKVEFILPKKFRDMTNTKQIFSKIRRLVRKYKPNISRSKKLSIQIDEEMYSYNNGYIEIMSNTKYKRLKLKVNTEKRFTGCIRLVIAEDKITISKAKDIKPKPIKYEKERIGIDRNYVNAIDTNTNNSYGLDFNELTKNYSDGLHEINQKRQVLWNRVKELKEKPNKTKKDLKLIYNITNFNLGKKKYERKKNRAKEEIKKLINKSITETIEKEKPKEIAVERLNFTSKRKSKFSKRVKRLLSTWMKGLVIERLKYKTEEKGIELIEVNAAYTSQECSRCHHFGVKRNDIFYCSNENCENSKGVHSGHEAARVILQRSYDDDIKLTNSAKKVKEILNERLCIIKPTQPRPNDS